MIQMNLLPDVKLEYIKAQRTRQMAVTIASIVTIVSIAILVLLLAANGLQKKHLNDLSKDINTESSKLKSEPDINRILTVQNQLESLTQLHDGKPAASRLFGYLNQVTPTQVSINNFATDFTTQTATITGSADALSSVNTYVDTLKFTKYTTDTVTDPAPAFSNVVLTSFGVSSGGSGKTATYTITLTYDKTIFDITQNVQLKVPSNATTTRSELNSANNLFENAPAAPNAKESQ